MKSIGRNIKEIHTSATFIDHSLEINDVIISAALLYKDDPSYRLAAFEHEREFKRDPLVFTYHGERYKIEPDGFLDFRAAGQRLPILLEHDMSTEGQTKFRGRIRTYVAMLYSGAFRERFKVKNSITIAFTTFKGDHRRDQMQGWTRAELERLGASENIALRFVFASAPKPPDPLNLWLEPCWRTLHDKQAISLLEQ